MEDYQILCRLCLSAKDVTVNLFKSTDNPEKYSERVAQFFRIKVNFFRPPQPLVLTNGFLSSSIRRRDGPKQSAKVVPMYWTR